MVRARPRVDRGALLLNIAVAVLIAALVYMALAIFGWNTTLPQRWPGFAPPRAAIGVIWLVLFGGMGAARWFAANSYDETACMNARAVVGLMLLCLAYPFYTHAIRGHATELTGNAASFAYAAWLIVRLRRPSPIAATLIGIVALWILFATVLVCGLIQRNGWAT